MKRKTYYEVYQGTDGKWRWRQVAANGQKTAAQGEYSATKRGAVKAIVTHARITHELACGWPAGDSLISKWLKEHDAIRFQEEGREVVWSKHA